MSILLDASARIIIQGITGVNGRNAAARMLEGNSPLVGGVTPGRAGENVHGLSVYGSCREAVERAGANASFVSVPAARTLEACLDAMGAGIRLLAVYTEGVPVADAVQLAAHARRHGATVLGPNSAGCVSPGLANLSDLNDANLDPGRVGIVSKSGTLTYEVIDGLRRLGLGESTIVCLGGDAVLGTDHRAVLELFEADRETECVVLIGEVGGGSELAAADFIREMRTPVVAYIAGRHAPAGKRMGHAGALLARAGEAAAAKIARLERAGARIARQVVDVPALVREALRAAGS